MAHRGHRQVEVGVMRNRFHSLCPYFAMFPESFAERWIAELTKPGEWVMDPFSGRGTTAVSALLLGRRAIASDVNDAAYCLTKAKTNAPSLSALRRRITMLERGFKARDWSNQARSMPEFFSYAFDKRALQQLLYLRGALQWRERDIDGMIAALTIGALHGELTSQWYLSNQMPRTISTKPGYSVRFWRERKLVPPERDAFKILRHWAEFRYESEAPSGEGRAYQLDVRDLPRSGTRLPKAVGCVITSPPYFDVTNFEEDQWLRLWFLGGPSQPTSGRLSRDDRHTFEDNYWRFIADMWRSLGSVLRPRAHVVIRIGGRKISPRRLKDKLEAAARFSARKVELVDWEASQIRNKQTDVFRPGSKGVAMEVDCHFALRN